MINLILVLNCGSSSLKFAVIDVSNETTYISGIAECLYTNKSNIVFTINKKKQKIIIKGIGSHSLALKLIVNNILTQNKEIYFNLKAIGHRIVHGGYKINKSAVINAKIIEYIKDAIHFAPLHNPAHITGIEASFKYFPNLKSKNVAVFDTAFYKDLEEKSYLYAIPYYFYKKYKIRRYGAHGISHFYVSRKVTQILNKPIEKINLISCHLGNGSSISAIKSGKCIDTSMGLTPLEGLVMGTRSGDIDPSIIFYLNETLGISLKDIKNIITKKSGLLGLTEFTNDCRDIEEGYHEKKQYKRAIDVYCHRLVKYIGSYSMLMDGKLDAIVFTGGIGENSHIVREISINQLSILGFKIDYEKNLNIRFGKSGIITKDYSKPVIVIPTNEELVIAQDTANLLI